MAIVTPKSRNDPCPCGSKKRYKDCHGALASTPLSTTSVGGIVDLGAVLNQALAAQLRGELVNAEQLYRTALAADPENFDALHMLGVVLLTLGRSSEAVQTIERARLLAPANLAACHNLALAIDSLVCSERMPSAFAAIETAASWIAQAGDREISTTDVALIAYYLPQFHSIPENDAWWGKDFTEWTNVRRGRPNYDGHYQPHVPADLGYYDLLDPTIRAKQAALAQAHGVTGFAYYHYWFRGRRLLEQPLEAVLRSKEPNFPFCVFWANESWSRRWDGGNHEALITQHHDLVDDQAFIEHLLPFFDDPRYIRVQGRPLLMVYRVDIFPNARATVQLWSDVCKAHGVEPPYLIKADTGQSGPPASYGFDASVEFPPHRLRPMASTESRPTGLDPQYAGAVFDMRAVIAQLTPPSEPAHRHFQCVVPAWDNTARKQLDGSMFVGERPELFRAWTRNALVRAETVHPPGERLVFVNAWNEWAEGAHLEPCEKYGTQWLQAARDARIVPAAFQPLHQLTDWEQEAALDPLIEALPVDALVTLATLKVRRDDVAGAVALLQRVCEHTQRVSLYSMEQIKIIAAALPVANLATARADIKRRRDFRKAARTQSAVATANPLVSVLVPSYRHEKFVEAALASIFQQTYRNIEVIIIDDGSPDGSVAVIEHTILNAPFPVRFIRRANRGAHATINEALRLAQGEYVNVLNSDDCFAPTRIAELVTAVHESGARWGYARTDFIDSDSQPLSGADSRVRPLIAMQARAATCDRHSLLFARDRNNPAISTGNLFVATEFMHQLGGYRDLRYVHDWDFCLRAILREEPVFVDQSLYRYRFHGKNTIFENEAAAIAESTQIVARYIVIASAETSPENPLLWSRAVDGLAFVASQFGTTQLLLPSKDEFTQMVVQLAMNTGK
jgi:glycosyltransferase involved in cell wall biosynthesis